MKLKILADCAIQKYHLMTSTHDNIPESTIKGSHQICTTDDLQDDNVSPRLESSAIKYINAEKRTHKERFFIL